MLLQSLEGRRFLSVSVQQTYPGYYEVVGDASDDTIVVDVSQDDGSFTLDGVTYTGVSYIFIDGGAGDDTVDVSASHPGLIGCSIEGGEGDDYVSLNFDGALWAGPGNDTLNLVDSFRGQVYGEEGNDFVYVSGKCVDPDIMAGDGNDLIDASGNEYGVVIHGGNGDDTIYGSQLDDQIYGDDGSDELFGLGGNDTFYCQDGYADRIHGGAGTDFLYGDVVEGHVDGVEYVFNG